MMKKRKILPGKKMFVVKKYVMARSARDAIKMEGKVSPDDVYVSDDWANGKGKELASAIGFSVSKKEEY